MFQEIQPVLQKKTDEIVFIELKEGGELKVGNTLLPAGIPLPIPTTDMVNKVQKSEDASIRVDHILESMVVVLGIDDSFPHAMAYNNILKDSDPKMEMRIMANGIQLAEEEKHIDALIRFKALMAMNPDSVDAQYNAARICEDVAAKHEDNADIYKRFNQTAYELFMDLLERGELLVLTKYHLGFHFANDQRFLQAEQVWKDALASGDLSDDQKTELVDRLRDLDAKIRYERGYKLVIDGQADQGLEYLLPLEPDYPEWWNLHFFIGLAFRQKEQFDEAITYFKRVLSLNTGHVETMNELGICLMTMGDYNGAEAYFKEALRAHPQNHEILCNLGIVHIQRGEYQDAMDKLNASLAQKPDDDVTLAWVRQLRSLLDQEKQYH